VTWHFDVFAIKIGSNIERLKNGRKGVNNATIGEKLVSALFAHFRFRSPYQCPRSILNLAYHTLLAQLWSETIQGSLPTKDTVKIEISPLNLTNVRRGTRAAENMMVGGRRAGFTTGLDLGALKGISAS
jgi:hypothetical protein